MHGNRQRNDVIEYPQMCAFFYNIIQCRKEKNQKQKNKRRLAVNYKIEANSKQTHNFSAKKKTATAL